MSSYQHKSGNVKRKEKDKRISDSVKGQQSLELFVKRQKTQDTDNLSEIDEATTSGVTPASLSCDSEAAISQIDSQVTEVHRNEESATELQQNEEISEMAITECQEQEQDNIWPE